MNRIASASMLAAACAAALSFGCASGTASRASRDNAARISLGEYREAARQLAVDIVSSPKFRRFRDKELTANDEIVVMLNDYRNETDNKVFNSSMRQLFTALEEALVENDMTFQQSLDRDLPNYSKAGERMARQDADDRYDQKTGTVTTGAAKKAVLALELEVQSSRTDIQSGGSMHEYALYARLTNAEQVTLISKSYPIAKPDR